MSEIRVASLAAIEEFEGVLTLFLSEFSYECKALRQSILDNITDIDNHLSEARIEHRSAVEYLHNIEESSWQDRDAVDDLENCHAKWSGFRDQFSDFSDAALAKVNEIESIQTRDVVTAMRFLIEVIDTAKSYLAITLDSGSNPSPGTVMQSGSDRESIAPITKPASEIKITSPIFGEDIKNLPKLPNGMQWIPIEKLDWAAVDDNIEFKKASETDIAAMMSVFERDLLPVLGANPQIELSTLKGQDRLAGKDAAATGRAFAYEFLIGTSVGSDVIAIDRLDHHTGGRHGWQSGRHRALVAKKLGWRFIPVRIVGGE